ncbi:hypothetical protein [Phenylobacterium immobile]|uniref:hypothetical protein n=1 Tax=Phenylobacterium immobile TaxID=21 RepID=UPI000AC59958|nr:hypothetical protein [Phenylobacterium immobile]
MSAQATFSFEIEIALDGSVEPYRPATYWEPAEGGQVEDLAVTDIGAIDAKRVNGTTVYRTRSLLDGIDRNDPAIQRLFDNILEMHREDAEYALCAEDERRAA